jgi:prophage antirepressor-like protein
MTNELAVFQYQAADVRVVRDEQGEPWWVAREVADILGITETSTIIERLDEEEWRKTRLLDARGAEQELFVISESGLYGAISRSNKPAAKDFQRWVRKEVLPSIRKTGSYSMSIPRTLPEALRLYAMEIEKREIVETQLAIAAPKVEFFNAVADSKDAIEMGRVAKVLDCGVGRNKLFQFLRDQKVLMHNNMPYQTFVDRRYFRVVEQAYNKPDGSVHVSTKTLVYQKGLQFILKSLGKRSKSLVVIH